LIKIFNMTNLRQVKLMDLEAESWSSPRIPQVAIHFGECRLIGLQIFSRNLALQPPPCVPMELATASAAGAGREHFDGTRRH
jgi:hypothetical protein